MIKITLYVAVIITLTLVTACGGTTSGEIHTTVSESAFQQSRTYLEQPECEPDDPEYACSGMILFEPDGSGYYHFGGDILWEMSYSIDGDRLRMNTEGQGVFDFSINDDLTQLVQDANAVIWLHQN